MRLGSTQYKMKNCVWKIAPLHSQPSRCSHLCFCHFLSAWLPPCGNLHPLLLAQNLCNKMKNAVCEKSLIDVKMVVIPTLRMKPETQTKRFKNNTHKKSKAWECQIKCLDSFIVIFTALAYQLKRLFKLKLPLVKHQHINYSCITNASHIETPPHYLLLQRLVLCLFPLSQQNHSVYTLSNSDDVVSSNSNFFFSLLRKILVFCACSWDESLPTFPLRQKNKQVRVR